MSSLKDTLNSLSIENNASPVNAAAFESPNEETVKAPTVNVKNINLDDVDWDKFTIGGVVVKELLQKALNSIIKEGYRPGQAITFKLAELYKRAGLLDVYEVYDQVVEGEESIIMAEDSDGYNWRWYVTEAVFDLFEDNGWCIDWAESDRPDKDMIERLFMMTTMIMPFIGNNRELAETANDPSVRHNTYVLLLEDSLQNDTITITVDSDEDYIGFADDDDVEIDDEHCGCDESKKASVNPTCSCRVSSPQRETPALQTLEDVMNILFGIKK